MFDLPDIAIGAIGAALIAATISFVGLVIGKEQKTSEFRQAWIDALRSDLSTFLTNMNAILDSEAASYKTIEEKLEKQGPIYKAINDANFNIVLRVNPDEKRSKPLFDAMKKFNSMVHDGGEFTRENKNAVEQEFLRASQKVLKAEWRRVKRGEPGFFIAKYIAAAVALALVAWIGVQMLHGPPAVTTSKTSMPSALEAKPALGK